MIGDEKLQKWVSVPQNMSISIPYAKAAVDKPLSENKIQYKAIIDEKQVLLQIKLGDEYQVGKNNQVYEDMCEMDVLNEPEVLYNVLKRYQKNNIFTFIGPTLIVVNPYQYLEETFNDKAINSIISEMQFSEQKKKRTPHIYTITAEAYKAMLTTKQKQSVVISGQSGAGKTQSTKYCMKFLTALSQGHGIQQKILACNPLLEAFGNSKTVRNDNSSRFGKYIQIFFDGGHIVGANIESYLLEKSRIVSIAKGERTYHSFYSLINSNKYDCREADQYELLRQSKMYEAANIDDQNWYTQITKAMDKIGFSAGEQSKIWLLLKNILNLGDLQFEDKEQLADEAKPCSISNRYSLKGIAEGLKIKEEHLQQILLFERRIFLKEVAMSAYSKEQCKGNRNTLCKAIYSRIFEFIISKIQQSLRPKSKGKFSSINILDIFGFENFECNSFEQLCINFTNERLLDLYNSYIFKKEIEILKEDGLDREVLQIKAPNNAQIIEMLAGKLSIFSIVNDLTLPKQFQDQDMIHSFQSKLINKQILKFNKINNAEFILEHSQCQVAYSIQGFKKKNQDKVKTEIEEIVATLFQKNTPSDSSAPSKTLLSKFTKGIEDLMSELNRSKVHFIRCIKPNNTKEPNFPEERYILTQIRYLGVFETIQIRRKTFPVRKQFHQFVAEYNILFPKIAATVPKQHVKKILAELKRNSDEFMIGNKRVYINKEIQNILQEKLYVLLKVKNQKASKIQKQLKVFVFRKKILRNLKILVKRKRLWKKILYRHQLSILQFSWQQMVMSSSLKKKSGREMPITKGKNTVADVKKHEGECQSGSMDTNRADETVFVEDSVIDDGSHYKKIQTTVIEEKPIIELDVDKSFFQDSSLNMSKIKSSEVLFEFGLKLPSHKDYPLGEKFEIMKRLVGEQSGLNLSSDMSDKIIPNSKDAEFNISQLPDAILNKFIAFPISNFFNSILRKRTNFLGGKKTYSEILVHKAKPLNKPLTELDASKEEEALYTFSLLLRIQDSGQIDVLFEYMEELMTLCQSFSKELVHEVFVQILRQMRNSNELNCMRIYQTLAVYLHIFLIDKDYLLAAAYIIYEDLLKDIFYKKLTDMMNYCMKKLLRKIESAMQIYYFPVRYQLSALICKKQITVPLYLPIGDYVLFEIESHETLSDIKVRALHRLGVNTDRFPKELFGFYQVINFHNIELEENPLREGQSVWDLITYWELAKKKYVEAGLYDPDFYLMVKLKYAIRLYRHDLELLELVYAQTFFDYFLGRVDLLLDKMGYLAACILKMKERVPSYKSSKKNQISSCFPLWATNRWSVEELKMALDFYVKELEARNPSSDDIKYIFLQLASQSPLVMASAVSSSEMKIFFKTKTIILIPKKGKLREIPIKNICEWNIQQEYVAFNEKVGGGVIKAHKYGIQHGFAVNQFLVDLNTLLVHPQDCFKPPAA